MLPPKNKTPDELAEDGVGLIAAAMMRSKMQTGSCRNSVLIAEAVMSVVSGMLLDFRHNLSKEPASREPE